MFLVWVEKIGKVSNYSYNFWYNCLKGFDKSYTKMYFLLNLKNYVNVMGE